MSKRKYDVPQDFVQQQIDVSLWYLYTEPCYIHVKTSKSEREMFPWTKPKFVKLNPNAFLAKQITDQDDSCYFCKRDDKARVQVRVQRVVEGTRTICKAATLGHRWDDQPVTWKICMDCFNRVLMSIREWNEWTNSKKMIIFKNLSQVPIVQHLENYITADVLNNVLSFIFTPGIQEISV